MYLISYVVTFVFECTAGGCCLLKTASVLGESCTAANSGDLEGHQAHFVI